MWRMVAQKREADLAEELEAHLAIDVQQLVDRGMPREQAETEARRLFGSRALVMEETREARGMGEWARILQDIRYAARVLRRMPAFTAAAVVSLALGIGATTAVFSIADTVFLRPLPYQDASRLYWIGAHFSSIDRDFLPSPDYVAWRRDNRTFESLAATMANFGYTAILNGPEPAEIHAVNVSANFLPTFGVVPAAGRNFTAEEELPNGPRATLLTDHFWRERFQARRDVVGSQISLDGRPVTIVGILPRSFAYPADVPIDILTTLPVSPTASHRDRTMSTWAVFGRIKPGVTMAQARADLSTLF